MKNTHILSRNRFFRLFVFYLLLFLSTPWPPATASEIPSRVIPFHKLVSFLSSGAYSSDSRTVAASAFEPVDHPVGDGPREKGPFFTTAVSILIGLLVAILLGLLFWNTMLRRAVSARTAALGNELGERKRADQRAEKARAYAQDLIDSSLDMIISVDRNDYIREFNPAARDTFGYSAEEIVGRPVKTLFAFEFEAEQVSRQLATNGRFIGEINNVRRNGETFSSLLTSAVLRDEHGELVGSVGISRDVTELKNVEAARMEYERRYRDLLDTIDDLIVFHDLDGTVLTLNAAAAKSLGYSPREIVGRPLVDFLIIPDARQSFSEYLQSIRDRESLVGVYKLTTRDGSEMYIEYRANLIARNGKAPYVSGAGRDITQRVFAKREIRRMEEQFIQSQKMEAIGTLASGIAHDFNNLLQAISGYVQIMMDRPSRSADDLGTLAAINGKVDRAADLVRRLLTFSRRVEPNLKPMDLRLEILDSKSILERTLPRMIRIEAALPDDLWLINGDPNQLEQVLFNLSTNAKDAMPDGGVLRFEAENVVVDRETVGEIGGLPGGKCVLLRVSDSGCGIKKEDLDRIFEPFFTTKDVGEGTGLGLPSVYGIVKNHGGHIQCESTPGSGTCFTITLPAIDLRPPPARDAGIDPGEALSGRETILIVDDEETILDITRDLLENHGYSILRAKSGEEACRVYQEEGGRIDLVLLDLNMPGMGGRRCLQKLLEMNPDARVIIASGYSPFDPSGQPRAAGARDFIAKPYRLKDMLLKVRRALDHPAPDE